MTKNFVKDLIKYLPSQIIPGIVGFISIPIITRLFTAHDYGQYSLIMAAVGALIALVGWLPLSVIRYYPVYERDNRLDLFYGNTVKLMCISLLCIMAILLISLYFTRTLFTHKSYILIGAGLGAFIATSVFNLFQHFLRAKRQLAWFNGFIIWKTIIGLGVGLSLVVFLKLNVEGLLWGIVFSVLVISPILWKKSIGSVPVLRSKMDIPLIKEMAWYGFPLVLGNLASWVLSLSDRYFLEIFRGSQEVGIYSASYNISFRSMMMIVNLFTFASRPIAISIWEKEGKVKCQEFTSDLARYYILVCIPAVVGLSILAKPIVDIMTGQEYIDGYKIIPVVTLGFFCFGLQRIYQSGFLFYKKTTFITVIVLIACLVSLTLNFIFIPKYGYYAAAVSTLVSYIVLLILMIIISRRLFIWRFPFGSLMRSVFASLIMGIIVYSISGRLDSMSVLQLLLIVCLGGFIYIILLFLLGELQAKEKEKIKQIFARYDHD